jgi:hypothetical protein
VPRDRQQRPRRQIAEDRPCGRQVVDRSHRRTGDDLSAQRTQIRRQRVGDALRATARHHPSDGMRRRREHQTHTCGEHGVERQHAVRGDAGEHRAGRISGERTGGEPLG